MSTWQELIFRNRLKTFWQQLTEIDCLKTFWQELIRSEIVSKPFGRNWLSQNLLAEITQNPLTGFNFQKSSQNLLWQWKIKVESWNLKNNFKKIKKWKLKKNRLKTFCGREGCLKPCHPSSSLKNQLLITIQMMIWWWYIYYGKIWSLVTKVIICH